MARFTLYFDDLLDAELLATIRSIPRGVRSARLKSILSQALTGTPGILTRLAELEARVTALEAQGCTDDSAIPPDAGLSGAASTADDPQEWQSDVMQSLLEGFDLDPSG